MHWCLHDCQKIFGEKLNSSRCYKLSEALVAADIIFDERAHDGLIDAYNTSLLFAKMCQPEFRLNRIYENARNEEEQHLQYSMEDMFKNLSIMACAG